MDELTYCVVSVNLLSSHPTFVSSQLMKYRSLDQPFFVEMSFSQHVRCECKWVLGCGRDSPHTPGGISQGLPIRAAVCASSLAEGGQGKAWAHRRGKKNYCHGSSITPFTHRLQDPTFMSAIGGMSWLWSPNPETGTPVDLLLPRLS